MKNVVIFQDFIDEKTYGYQWREEELYNYFRAQIDNSIDLVGNQKMLLSLLIWILNIEMCQF